MIVTITGKHIEITDAMRAHIEDKASKLPRYMNLVSQVDVIVEKSTGVMQSVEIIASVEHCDDVVARESGEDLYACIDLAMHKMERQLRKLKEKQRDNKYPSPAERERQSEPTQIQEGEAL
ncbi:MAG: ribosome-associated translation inhibitor RaiA [Planctomycetes bacterium]|jgi:putative sigma-54 modulation protein|nr:ribosome-associated translation inhibitor RaiA [Planctomycetota bacterium]